MMKHERWMLDAERGDCEPIEAVLLPKGSAVDLPENGTELTRYSDLLQAIEQRDEAQAINRTGCAHSVHQEGCAHCEMHGMWMAAKARADKAEAAIEQRDAEWRKRLAELAAWFDQQAGAARSSGTFWARGTRTAYESASGQVKQLLTALKEPTR